MPGKMDSILNVGINDRTVRTMARERGGQFAYESYASFLQRYGKVVLDVPASAFDGIRSQQLQEGGRSEGTSARTCQLFKDLVRRDAGLPIPQDAATQRPSCTSPSRLLRARSRPNDPFVYRAQAAAGS
jgi:pyruvate,orthophosphate dikinase